MGFNRIAKYVSDKNIFKQNIQNVFQKVGKLAKLYKRRQEVLFCLQFFIDKQCYLNEKSKSANIVIENTKS